MLLSFLLRSDLHQRVMAGKAHQCQDGWRCCSGLTIMCIEILSTADLPEEENAAPCADQYWYIALGLPHCAQIDLLLCSCGAIQHCGFGLGLLCCA